MTEPAKPEERCPPTFDVYIRMVEKLEAAEAKLAERDEHLRELEAELGRCVACRETVEAQYDLLEAERDRLVEALRKCVEANKLAISMEGDGIDSDEYERIFKQAESVLSAYDKAAAT